jgi:hypothetical protein
MTYINRGWLVLRTLEGTVGGNITQFKERELMNVPSAPVLVRSVQQLGARPISDLDGLTRQYRKQIQFQKGEQNVN